MKKILTIIFFMMSPHIYAEWLPITQSDIEDVYLRAGSVKQISNTNVVAWFLFSDKEKQVNKQVNNNHRSFLKTPDEQLIDEIKAQTRFYEEQTNPTSMSLVRLNEFDCAHKATRTLQDTRYKEKMGKGEAISTDTHLTKWQYVVPGTVSEAIMQTACVFLEKKQNETPKNKTANKRTM